jgi:hypothetical protein
MLSDAAGMGDRWRLDLPSASACVRRGVLGGVYLDLTPGVLAGIVVEGGAGK